MALGENMPPITLYPSRAKMLALLACSLAFVAVGVWFRSAAVGMWLVVGFFGICSVVLLVTSLPGASFLRIEEDGFTFVSLYGPSTLKWSEVTGFYPGKIARRRMVLFDFNPPLASGKKIRRMNLAICGHEAALPDTYGMSAADLAALLNRWKQQHEKSA